MSNKSVQTAAKALPDEMNRGGRRVVRALINGFMHLIFRMKYIDQSKLLDKGPLILISNHVSMFDVPALHVNFEPWIYFVAKEELFRNKWAGRFFRWWGAIPINREKTSLSSAREILKCLQDGKIVSIYPEGTRVPVGADHRDYLPKSGVLHFARRSGAVIQPVGVKGNFKFRGRVTVTVGNPFTYEDIKAGPNRVRSDEEMVIEMMRRVYELNGVDYLPEENTGRER